MSPIATPRHQVIGTVNVDSLSTYLDDPNINFDFENHEINFYQVYNTVILKFWDLIFFTDQRIIHVCILE